MTKLSYKEKQVLIRTLDLDKLLETSPELFNFNKLAFADKIDLLQSDLERFIKCVSLDKISSDQKYEILTNSRLAAIHKDFTLEKSEVGTLKDEHYMGLLKTNFKTYIDKNRVLKLKRDDQSTIFLQNPDWYFKELPDNMPRLTSDTLTALALKKPKFVDKYVTDFSNLSTTERFWRIMIKYSDTYKVKFIENSKSLITKTDVRRVFDVYPDMVKLLTPDNILQCKLSVKELVLLIDGYIKNNKKELVGWEFSSEMKELIKQDLSAEILSGKSRFSTQLASAVARITA